MFFFQSQLQALSAGNQIGGRFVNKDGSFNLRKEGLPPLMDV